MSRINAIIVSAPSGAGKSTVVRGVLREVPGLRFSVSHTTRAPRSNETDGIEYHFVDRPAFDDLIDRGAFLEWADVYGQRYGTARFELERAEQEGRDLLLDVDVQGAAQIRAQIEDCVSIFVLPPSHDSLEARLRGRGMDADAVVRRRLAAARQEVDRFGEYDYLVVNQDLDICVEAVTGIVRAARFRRRLMEETARRIASSFAEGGDRPGSNPNKERKEP